MTSAIGIALVFSVSALVCAGVILLLRPLWKHYALAKPNARSSHTTPTPQGGGIAVVAATGAIGASAMVLMPGLDGSVTQFAWVCGPVVFLAIVGAIDDVHTLEAVPRLVLQTLAVAVVVMALPSDLRVVDTLPWWLERSLLIVGGVWFVNLVNFMDGIDWMTVAEVAPVTAGLALFGLMGALPPDATVVAVALCGAVIGFAPFNRPVARLFLGDVGSLPIGLLLSWLLVMLAGGGHLAAALLLPLYYTADATITLLRRLANGEQVLQAHRSHFYQRAMDRGLSVRQIVGRVFGVNVLLIGLAAITLVDKSLWLQGLALVAGGALVAVLLWDLGRVRRSIDI